MKKKREINILDVVIAGGGPAGLSAALVLGRSLKNVTVIDDGRPRNFVTAASHGFLTRDGIKPSELRKIAHEQLTKYQNVKITEDFIEKVEKKNNVFITTTKSGKTMVSKKIVFGTGMKDHLPAIDGLQEVYGKTVFHCPYCDGWERRNEPLAVFGNGKGLLPFIKLIYNWSEDLIAFTNGTADITKEEKQELIQHNIPLIESPIIEFQSTKGNLDRIILQNGDAVRRKGGFWVTTNEQQASMIPALLGVPLNENGEYETGDHGQTNIKGLSIVGDAKNSFTSLIGAAEQGYEIGVKINGELAEEKWADKLL
ncbi:NAD(P)/FAD-dependent oxidoreductase [Domibacillus aminovorans]|uniref:Pyridine nucleotide-disulfide oxidoreductase n=1 Tax=Domibacillus aminovorans TaxID=29332 RepID=A0A177L7C6_9BACI|nr:NAD(P)/FAD-dependent oxidoreductase [Domibacillus aminovorans]OAH61276.1 pyridine nucleotide-disulfide oxidoreductase [Domibacillus aminovorans]